MKLLNEPKEATRVTTFGLKNTDRPLEQAETRLQETLKFKMSKSKETFFFGTPMELREEKWIMGVTYLDVINSLVLIKYKTHVFPFSLLIFMTMILQPAKWNT